MKKVAYWAVYNPVKARIGIALSYVILFPLFAYYGLFLYANDLYLSLSIFYLIAGLFFLSYLLYPIRGVQRGLFKHSFIRQKSMDFLLIFLACTALTIRFNTLAWQADTEASARGRAVFATIYSTPHTASPEIQTAHPQILHVMRDRLRAEVRAYKQHIQADQDNTGSKIGLILLTLVGASGLLYLVAGWSCSLSCSGQEGAAVIVLVGGLAVIVWLCVLAIRAILGKKMRAKPPTVKQG